MAQAHRSIDPAELIALASAMREAGISEFTTPEGAVIKLGPPPAKNIASGKDVNEAINLARARRQEATLYAASTGCSIKPPA